MVGEKVEVNDEDKLVIRPLGAGQEVGRSCIYVEFKEKKILLDCGIHPGKSGDESLPYFDIIDPSTIDLLLITHFHLDHCGSLPWLLENTKFKGKIYMTHATKAIYRYIMSDFIKVNESHDGKKLFTEASIEKSMERIETINIHQEIEVNGIKFTGYTAGHVLGAAMFLVEIGGTKILYTGDYCCEEDRHLLPAELPPVCPGILIIEATYSTQIHEDRGVRESRFCQKIRDIVARGGRCLIPMFALGRAQEIMLIIDEYWQMNKELHHIPVVHASTLTSRCLNVFKAYTSSMNQNIQDKLAFGSPFDFKFIKSLPQLENFDDIGPSVVLASPGMLQSGISRELFELWCSDEKNGTVIAGYCVEGTLARNIINEPGEVTSISGQRLKLKCSVDYISFSAHADYKQTSKFIKDLKAPNIIFVHGERSGMTRLREAIHKQYIDNPDYKPNLFEPMNTQAVELFFQRSKVAKVIGKMSDSVVTNGNIDGIIVKENFNYTVLSEKDMEHFFDIPISHITQRLAVPFNKSKDELEQCLKLITNDIVKCQSESVTYKLYNEAISVTIANDKVCVLEWGSGYLNDSLADTIIANIASASISNQNLNFCNSNEQIDKSLSKEELRRNSYISTLNKWLSSTFGPNAQSENLLDCNDGVFVFQNEHINAKISLNSQDVCCENESVKSLIGHGLKVLNGFFLQ